MSERSFEVFGGGEGRPVKAWTRGVPVEAAAKGQLLKVAQLPFVFRWIAAMPDVHLGVGATVGSVIPTKRAIIPAAVGVDIGCGMTATLTSLRASELPDSLVALRGAIEAKIPHGRTHNGGPGDRGAYHDPPRRQLEAWRGLEPGYRLLVEKVPRIGRGPALEHLGTLGTGNHFIELCLDEEDRVWIMLHSGSRGVGNRIGQSYIRLAKQEMRTWFVTLPDQDLAYLPEGTQHFDDYVHAVAWAQRFAQANRQLMLEGVIEALSQSKQLPSFSRLGQVVDCHHNYVEREHHFGEEVLVTRKGAIRARVGDLGIIPGSMGACSYIVRGLGCAEAFSSASHGAGRAMSRTEARRRFNVEDHAAATRGIECRKDLEVIDETPGAYKPIEAVMAAQAELCEPVHLLKQVLCVKG